MAWAALFIVAKAAPRQDRSRRYNEIASFEPFQKNGVVKPAVGGDARSAGVRARRRSADARIPPIPAPIMSGANHGMVVSTKNGGDSTLIYNFQDKKGAHEGALFVLDIILAILVVGLT